MRLVGQRLVLRLGDLRDRLRDLLLEVRLGAGRSGLRRGDVIVRRLRLDVVGGDERLQLVDEADHLAADGILVARTRVRERQVLHRLRAEIAHLEVLRLRRLAGEVGHQRRVADVVDALAEALPRERVEDAVVDAVGEHHRLVRRAVVVVGAEVVRVVAKRRVARQVRAEAVLAAAERGILRADVLVRVPRDMARAVHLVPEVGQCRIRRVTRRVVPVVEVARLGEDGLSGDEELEPRLLVRLEDRTVVRKPLRARLVAVAHVDVVVPEAAVELVRHALRVLLHLRTIAAGRIRDALQDVRAHAGLLHDLDRLERLVVEVAAHHVHRLVVRDLVAQDGDELLARQRLVPAVLLLDVVEREIRVRRDEEVLLRLVVALRLRQHEVKHPDLHRNPSQHLPLLVVVRLLSPNHLSPIQPRLRVLRRMRRQEELAERLLRQGDWLQRRRIAEVLAHGVEGVLFAPSLAQLAPVHLPRRIEPLLGLLAVLLDEPRVVRLLLGVDADEVLVIHQQLGAELEARVAEVAEPAVPVLVPDLHELEVEVLLREENARLLPSSSTFNLNLLEISDFKLHLPEVLRSPEEEGARLVFVLRRNDAHGPVRRAVRRIDVRETLDLAHRRHRVMPDLRARPGREVRRDLLRHRIPRRREGG